VSVGAYESRMYADFVRALGLDPEEFPQTHERDSWPPLRARVADAFKGKTRDQWCEVMDSYDANFAPVLTPDEAPEHPHNHARGTLIEIGDILQPAPAPRFDRTPAGVPTPPRPVGADTEEALLDWGLNQSEVDQWRRAGTVAQHESDGA
jgi:alpha-methylacyl-CoA racemase